MHEPLNPDILGVYHVCYNIIGNLLAIIHSRSYWIYSFKTTRFSGCSNYTCYLYPASFNLHDFKQLGNADYYNLDNCRCSRSDGY